MHTTVRLKTKSGFKALTGDGPVNKGGSLIDKGPPPVSLLVGRKVVIQVTFIFKVK